MGYYTDTQYSEQLPRNVKKELKNWLFVPKEKFKELVNNAQITLLKNQN